MKGPEDFDGSGEESGEDAEFTRDEFDVNSLDSGAETPETPEIREFAAGELSADDLANIEATRALQEKLQPRVIEMLADGRLEGLTTPERRIHILDGDGPGSGSGGHRHPGDGVKSTFPESWSDDKIMREIESLVTDPDVKWLTQGKPWGELARPDGRTARLYARGERDGVRIKVVFEPDSNWIVTGFPQRRRK